MQSGKRVEQVILTRVGGSFDALVVTEAPSGARQRERWPSIAQDAESAIDRLVALLARRSDVEGGVRRLRVRVGQGDALQDRPDLMRRLRRALDRDED